MNRLLAAFPLYHTVPAEFFARYLGMDTRPIVGTVICNGVYLEKSMEILVDQALRTPGWDRILFMETDTIPPAHALRRVEQYGPEHDIVGSVYFSHSSPHNVHCYVQEPEGPVHNPLTPATIKQWCDVPGLYDCSAVGFGFTSIARHVLEDWDPTIPMFARDGRGLDFGSHDLWFCFHARQQGYRVYLDSGIQCTHLTSVPIGLEHNQAHAHEIDGAQIISFGTVEPEPPRSARRRLLNLGGGSKTILLPEDLRDCDVDLVDIEPGPDVDIIADARNLTDTVTQGAYDVVYASHVIEHVAEHEHRQVLDGAMHALRPGGLIEIRCPDIKEVARRLTEVGLTDMLYLSPAGPITAHDVLYGHGPSLAGGSGSMAHRSGFTAETLHLTLTRAGFIDVGVKAEGLELTARGFRPPL